MARSRHVYVASAAPEPGEPGDGIFMFEQDGATGELRPTPVHAATPGATFLAVSPGGRHLYATRSGDDGGVAGFGIGPDGALTPLGEVSTGGAGTCHVAVHPSGRYVISADYGSGHVAVHRIGADGSFGERCDLVVGEGSGPDPDRQEHAHAHFCWPEPGGRYVLVVDLGTDSVSSYPIDPGTGRLGAPTVGAAEPGSGPRHLVAHPDGYLLVTGELGSSLMTFAYDPETCTARWLTSVPATGLVPAGENAPSELALAPGGRYCYVANRGAESIGVFALGDGTPELVGEVSCGGSWPRHLAVVGEHLYVANQESGAVVTFEIDAISGVPRPVGSVEVRRPYCVLAVP